MRAVQQRGYGGPREVLQVAHRDDPLAQAADAAAVVRHGRPAGKVAVSVAA